MLRLILILEKDVGLRRYSFLQPFLKLMIVKVALDPSLIIFGLFSDWCMNVEVFVKLAAVSHGVTALLLLPLFLFLLYDVP